MEELYKLMTATRGRYYRIAMSVLTLLGFLSIVAGAQDAGNTVICNIFLVYNSVKTAIFIIGITLMILGGALYAGSHVMPGQSKGNLQGYGMGMILGGVIGVIIAVIAPFIFSVIVGGNGSFGNNAITTGNPGGC